MSPIEVIKKKNKNVIDITWRFIINVKCETILNKKYHKYAVFGWLIVNTRSDLIFFLNEIALIVY